MTGELVSALRDLVREVVREELARERVEPHAEPAEYLSISAAAALASVAKGTVRRWVREGRIPEHRAGRVLRVHRGDLERLLAAGQRHRGANAEPTPEELARRDFDCTMGDNG